VAHLFLVDRLWSSYLQISLEISCCSTSATDGVETLVIKMTQHWYSQWLK